MRHGLVMILTDKEFRHEWRFVMIEPYRKSMTGDVELDESLAKIFRPAVEALEVHDG
jgi:hypothetical protein